MRASAHTGPFRTWGGAAFKLAAPSDHLRRCNNTMPVMVTPIPRLVLNRPGITARESSANRKVRPARLVAALVCGLGCDLSYDAR
jgi:hypothetical protein